MCIRDRLHGVLAGVPGRRWRDLDRAHAGIDDRRHGGRLPGCLLYTSDAADERSSVDLGGRRIIKKKKLIQTYTARRPELRTQRRATQRHTN